MLFVGTRFSSLYTATVRDPRPELPASGVTKSKEEEEEEEEEEEDLFVFNDTIEGPRAPDQVPGEHVLYYRERLLYYREHQRCPL